jgi:hypothetical protein
MDNNIRERIEEYDNEDIKKLSFNGLINFIDNLNQVYNQRLLKFTIINNKVVIVFNYYYKNNFFYKDFDKIKLRYEYLKKLTKRIINRILKEFQKYDAYIILTGYEDYFMNDTITPIFENLLITYPNIVNFLNR